MSAIVVGDIGRTNICQTFGFETTCAFNDFAAIGHSAHMIDFFKTPQDRTKYLNRGPRSGYIKDIPIQLMINPKAPLIGAAKLYMDNYYA